MNFTWARNNGYEVSSAGDLRFSAFYARMPDGRSIEHHYQCDIKGYDPGGTNWKLGKGKPALPRLGNPVTPSVLWQEYLGLWITWSQNNLLLMRSLHNKARKHDNVLSDRFANTGINQARALAYLLNNRHLWLGKTVL